MLKELGVYPGSNIFIQTKTLFILKLRSKSISDLLIFPFIFYAVGHIIFEKWESGERILWWINRRFKKQPIALILLGLYLESAKKFKKAYILWKLYNRRFGSDFYLSLRKWDVQNRIGLQELSISAIQEALKGKHTTEQKRQMVLVLSDAFYENKDYNEAFLILKEAYLKGDRTLPLMKKLVMSAYPALQFDFGDQILDELKSNALQFKLFEIECLFLKNQYHDALNKVENLVKSNPTNRRILWMQYSFYNRYFNKTLEGVLANRLQKMLKALEKNKGLFESRVLKEKISMSILRGQRENAISLIKKLPTNNSKFNLKVKMWMNYQIGNFSEERRLWNTFKKLYYIPQIQPLSNPNELKYVYGDYSVKVEGEIILFTCIKNEMDRLEWFLSYYRDLGVTRFFFIDNDSNDLSCSILKKQSDVVLFHTSEKYSRGYSGIKWINSLIKDFAKNNWCLYVDVDEALVYDQVETIKLPELTAKLEADNFSALHAPMLDMFSINQTKKSHSEDYLIRYPFYLKDKSSSGSLRPPYVSEFGGIRKLFKVYECHTKVPLIHAKYGIQFLASSHNISPASIKLNAGVLLHFRLIDNFFEKTKKALEEENRVAACTIRLKSYIDSEENLKLADIQNHLGLRRYSGSYNLVEEGLIKELWN